MSLNKAKPNISASSYTAKALCAAAAEMSKPVALRGYICNKTGGNFKNQL